jgi:hypothetical protein
VTGTFAAVRHIIDDRARWPDDAAVILSCPFPAKFGLSVAIPGHFLKLRTLFLVDKSGSAHGSPTSERNFDDAYLFVIQFQ